VSGMAKGVKPGGENEKRERYREKRTLPLTWQKSTLRKERNEGFASESSKGGRRGRQVQFHEGRKLKNSKIKKRKRNGGRRKEIIRGAYVQKPLTRQQANRP